MSTRKQEKQQHTKTELNHITQTVRDRAIGQKMKDNHYTSLIHNNKDKLSPSKREQKRITTLNKRIVP